MTDDEADLDLEHRELCPDGGCIGVLGADGRCSECGRTREQAAAGVEPASGAFGGDDVPVGSLMLEGGFEADRELCPDGACIGVLGPDGRCKECGRSREPD